VKAGETKMEHEDDPFEYVLDQLRDGEITREKFAAELRLIGYGDPEIAEILAEEPDFAEINGQFGVGA
jgi:hypothetical protein